MPDFTPPTLDQVDREAAITRLLIAVDYLGWDDVEGMLADVQRYGVAEVQRWLSNIRACQAEGL